ncbi:MAG: hypothetical protein JSS60_00160 [Verrucomicrobia bacterium]|nr:hypothetical protein [Verrucomicrobiota bacterium]
MKKMLLFFLLLANYSWATVGKQEPSEPCALSGFQSFEVITVFFSDSKVDQKVVHDSLVESFKKYGKVEASENESMLVDLLEKGVSSPVCLFSIDKRMDHIEVSLNVSAEAEILKNKHKTTCTIWQDTLYADLPQDKKLEDLEIANKTQEIVNLFVEKWKKANPSDSKELSFRIRTFKSF